jgi:hypothetical protein
MLGHHKQTFGKCPVTSTLLAKAWPSTSKPLADACLSQANCWQILGSRRQANYWQMLGRHSQTVGKRVDVTSTLLTSAWPSTGNPFGNCLGRHKPTIGKSLAATGKQTVGKCLAVTSNPFGKQTVGK